MFLYAVNTYPAKRIETCNIGEVCQRGDRSDKQK